MTDVAASAVVTPPGNVPAGGWDHYEIQTCVGTTCTAQPNCLVGSTPSANCPLSSLVPNTAYTVVAVAAQGNIRSQTSTPDAFHTLYG